MTCAAAYNRAGPASVVAVAVMASIEGGRNADGILLTIKSGCAGQDLLFEAICSEMRAGSVERLRGFVRQVQKQLEVVR